MSRTKDRNLEARLVHALDHPLRRRILKWALSGSEQFSPSELSDKWSEPLSHVSYHIRVLKELGVITLIATKPVRGSTQHFYVLSRDADRPWVRTVLGLNGSSA